MSVDNSGADRAVDVAIVGGGFGAISAALVLEKELANGWPATAVTSHLHRCCRKSRLRSSVTSMW